MNSLPNELLLLIADWCDMRGRKALASACYNLRALIWRRLPLLCAHRQKYIAVVREINLIEHVMIIIPNLYTIYSHKANNGSVSIIEYTHLQSTKKVVYLSTIITGTTQKYKSLNCISVCKKISYVKKMYNNKSCAVEYIAYDARQRVAPYVKFKCGEITLQDLIDMVLTTQYTPLTPYVIYKN